MEPATNADSPGPEPVLTRSLGISVIVIGVLMLLGGLLEAGIILAMPIYGGLMEKVQAIQTEQVEARNKASRDRFEQKLKDAGSVEDRARIEAERAIAEMNMTEMPMVTSFGLDFLDDSEIRSKALVKFGVLTVLNILMVSSGIGLARLKPWGRRLAIGTALLKIPTLIVFSVITIGLAPIMADRWTESMTEMIVGPMEADEEALSAEFREAMDPYRADMERSFAIASGTTYALGLVVPVVILVLVTRSGVASAVRRDAIL